MTNVLGVVFSTIGFALLSPLFAIVAVAIKLDDGGPVFYRQERVGKNFRKFWMLKFRSMIVNADRHGLLTASKDSRVTRVGRFLRKWKLDELPQLLNVIKGEMQLVGPRPEVSRYVEMFRGQYALLLTEPPGITDPASIAYRHEEALFNTTGVENQYLSDILPDKLRLSLEYRQRRSLFSDLDVIVRTLLSLEVPNARLK